MKNSELQLYTDYLLSSFGATTATTATGLSAMVQGDVSHDRITRFLSGQDRQVFKSQDSNAGRLHLVCSDLTCDHDVITTVYKKRWQVKVFYKFLKSNAGMAKSPTQALRTQSNHVFMAIYAVFKLECLCVISKINLFALRFKLLINATRGAFDQLQKFQAAA